MMIKRTMTGAALAAVAAATMLFSEPAARVSIVEGSASLLRQGSAEWRDLRPNAALEIGDQVYTREESFVEVRYAMGAVVRLNENSKITLQSVSEQAAKTQTSLGQVWVNAKKLAKKGKSFEMASPTAVAAVRGTEYEMNTAADSSTDVLVFEGKVAVGPSDDLKQRIQASKPAPVPTERVEVPGPEEIPGPFEVSLEAWRSIVSGQMISVRKDGKFAQKKFDMKAPSNSAFVKKCQALDKKEGQE